MDLFQVGAQCGLKPNDVLDMSLDMLKACIQGYSDHLFDLETVGIKAGFWAGYYSKAKRPRSYVRVIKDLIKKRRLGKSPANKPNVDVEAFKSMENKFWAAYSQKGR